MHRTIAFGVVAAILLTHPSVCRPQAGLPFGTYSRTCQNIRVNGNQVSASCQKVDGGWRNTSIDYSSCRGGQLINDNGNLRCAEESQGGWRASGGQGGLPPGDYKRTCQNMYMEGAKLSGTCRKVDGSWNDTSLKNVNQCRTRIVNDNGNLTCQK